MPDERDELAQRALKWSKDNDGGRLGMWWPAGSKPDDDSRPIMAVMWDNGGTGELGSFYDRKDAEAMQIICDLANWALEELVPSKRGWYGTRTYAPTRPTCWCSTCYDTFADEMDEYDPDQLTASFMALCPDCGNKRCPKATHHDHACTRSNESGQLGSRYE